jgi:hypothetical protein
MKVVDEGGGGEGGRGARRIEGRQGLTIFHLFFYYHAHQHTHTHTHTTHHDDARV